MVTGLATATATPASSAVSAPPVEVEVGRLTGEATSNGFLVSGAWVTANGLTGSGDAAGGGDGNAAGGGDGNDAGIAGTDAGPATGANV